MESDHLGKIFSIALAGITILSTSLRAADTSHDSDFSKEAQQQQSPSFQQKKWTGTQGATEAFLEYDYVAPASQNLGNGKNEHVDSNYFDFRLGMMRHTLLAFLVQGGLEYQHLDFNVPNDSLVPDRLETLVGDIALDTRWSEKDLLHLETRPGFFTDFRGSGWDAINSPLDIGYTRVVSNRFQWVVGFNLNTWRSSRFLGAAGLRWQINDRWKLKLYMPTPDIEYYARPNLTITVGADVRGDSYRVGPHFGDSKGVPTLNSALVDYQEVRVGPGFSWNIRPLIEMNFMTGYMVGRQYDFHNNGVVLNGSGSPFVMIQIHALFKMAGEALVIPQKNNISLHDVLKYF